MVEHLPFCPLDASLRASFFGMGLACHLLDAEFLFGRFPLLTLIFVGCLRLKFLTLFASLGER